MSDLYCTACGERTLDKLSQDQHGTAYGCQSCNSFYILVIFPGRSYHAFDMGAKPLYEALREAEMERESPYDKGVTL